MHKNVGFIFCYILAVLTALAPLGVFAQDSANAAKQKASLVSGVRRALIIAVSHYESKELPNLLAVDNDVKMLKAELLNAGFEEQNIRVLEHNGVVPTKARIKEEIESFARSCESEDLAFIALTGHGLRDVENNKDYFVPFDGDDADFNSLVPLDFVVSSLESSRAKFKWLFVDACRNMGKGADDSSIGRLFASKPGMLIFQSCSPREKSYTNGEEYSFFLYYFIKGLQGGAIQEDGRVSVLDAYQYACNKIRDKQQHPTMSSKGFTDFVLSENNAWISAADYRRMALEFRDKGDYEQALSMIRNALKYKTPLRSYYVKDAKNIFELYKINVGIQAPVIAPEEPSVELGESDDQNVVASDMAARDEWEKAKAGKGRSLTINGVKTVFRYCPSGAFDMGSPEREKERDSDETLHSAMLSQGFWMMETETTQKLWRAVMENNPSKFRGDYLPVETVSWEDCQSFVEKLNDLKAIPKGMKFALPTEAQWEYACRANDAAIDRAAFPWGFVLNGNEANCNGNKPYVSTVAGPYIMQTTLVRSYEPNAWNLYNMNGNVAEWCQDVLTDYPKESQLDPCVEEGNAERVVRGGGWDSDAKDCRSAARDSCDPKETSSNVGFRVVIIFQ